MGRTARPTWRRLRTDVFDRVGGGDGFASGFFYGLLTGETPEECVKLGWAHGALLTTFPGDTTMATARAGARLRQGRLGADSALSVAIGEAVSPGGPRSAAAVEGPATSFDRARQESAPS